MDFRPDGSLLERTALSMSQLSPQEPSADAAETARLVRLTLDGHSAAFAAPEPATIIEAAGTTPKKSVTLVSGLGVVGVLGALLLLANAAATSRPPAERAVDQSAVEGSAAPEVQAQQGGDRVMGAIELDASAVNGVVFPAIVFVYARAENTSVGPPMAALRLQVSSFPIVFSLGPEHAMSGGTLPRKVRVEARIDPDGNASTREPDARRAFVDSVDLGASNVRLLLK